MLDVFWFVCRCFGLVFMVLGCLFGCVFMAGLAGWMWVMRPRHRPDPEWYCTASGWTKAEILHRGHCTHPGPCPMDLREV